MAEKSYVSRTQTLAQAELDTENGHAEPSGVSIKLFDESGNSGNAGKSAADATSDKRDANPILRLMPENVAIPIVYTRPDTLQQMSHLMKCANDEVLQTFQMRIAEINVMFKSLMSISHIEDTIGLLQSYVRSQKDFVETAMSSLSAVLVTGSTTS